MEKCIQSVLNQSYSLIEHIFIDGDSTDGTLGILTDYGVRYPDKIRFISEPDRGAADAWNKGWKMAKGRIFGWLGADDMYVPHTVSTVVEFFQTNSEAYFVFGGCDFINEKDEVIRKHIIKDFNLKDAINDWAYIPTSSAFYRREVIEKVGFLDESTCANDLDYWIRVGKVFRIHRIEKVLSRFRKHKYSATRSYKGSIRYAWESIIVSRRYGGNMFSSYKRYLRFLIIEPLEPVLGFSYPFLKKLLKIE